MRSFTGFKHSKAPNEITSSCLHCVLNELHEYKHLCSFLIFKEIWLSYLVREDN